MLRLLMVIGVLGWALPTQAADISNTFAQWQRLRDPATISVSFIEGASFLYEFPNWPDENTIRLRTEAAALYERPSNELMSKFCTDFPPISGRGMVACASNGVSDKAKQTAWVKQGWAQGDFNEDEEQRILKAYDGTLTSADHAARAERLLCRAKSTMAAPSTISS